MKSYLTCKVSIDEVIVIIDGIPYNVSRKMREADQVIELVKKFNNNNNKEEREQLLAQISNIVVLARRIEHESDGRFEFDGKNSIYLKGTSTPIDKFLAKLLVKYLKEGLPIEALVNFWKNVLLNPNPVVKLQLYGFLKNNGHPITSKGYFLAYKSCCVKKSYDKTTGEEKQIFEFNEDTGELDKKYTQDLIYTPWHTGGWGMIIKCGDPVKMPREECDANPDNTCSDGLHVGNMDYVHDFNMGSEQSVVLEVLVNPRNVVAVPLDYSNTKMRVCEYYPIAISNGENKTIYLESDYTAFDKEQLNKDIAMFEKNKNEQMEELEKELEETRLIVGTLEIY